MTLHLSWSLANGISLRDDKMSSTNPNLIFSDVLSSIIQREEMRKNPFWYFWFGQLWPFNFYFGCRPKSSNHIILVFAHSISKLKIVPEISQSRELMVTNPFGYFECFTFENPCDSTTSPRAKIRHVTPDKFSKHGFSFFHLNLPFSFESWLRWHFGFLI